MNFTDTQKKIFSYFNGKEYVSTDPLEIKDKVSKYNLSSIIDQANSNLWGADATTIRLALMAQEKLYLLVREIFGFADFDRATGLGVTEKLVRDTWKSFCTYLRDKKDKCRKLSDRIALFHNYPQEMTYEEYVGLELNIRRLEWKQGYMMAQAIIVGMGYGNIPVAMMDAVASSDEEAESLAFDANAARQFQRAQQEINRK